MDKKTKQFIDDLTTDTEMLRFIAAKSHESERHLNGIRNVTLFFCILAIIGITLYIIK